MTRWPFSTDSRYDLPAAAVVATPRRMADTTRPVSVWPVNGEPSSNTSQAFPLAAMHRVPLDPLSKRFGPVEVVEVPEAIPRDEMERG